VWDVIWEQEQDRSTVVSEDNAPIAQHPHGIDIVHKHTDSEEEEGERREVRVACVCVCLGVLGTFFFFCHFFCVGRRN
jgi:hypothetical protein